MQKVLLFFWIIACFGFMNPFPSTTKEKIHWISFEEAEKLNKEKPLPILVDIYTDWCGWCKVMDKNTFADPEVARILNEKFYPVKFNAEQREDVTFQGNTFKFAAYGNGGTHELASALLQNR